ncbi:SigB/SigF/SigG family RNA polymerase sigma factor [Solirubrobacter sp. CPCC 204708]|uniref:SigB/SigF/SigG family RNA polymerase sigma factor n=1 Tax=Solirubrobacter deserti TaxID=2282478 RepID=A0ABT4RCN9_9ACTN|nr:SigB/SigF/SigG family RNA polymerase sigma factor [Solirubrobacter deserti]MBE2315657.1 SigB/SigF/SigG family RNA polymerase sigma factor [Solirubrobacter deserti]MDA0136297.1 SigB/SigF/SigG family RNA polymerase sigma factor [Solirubrobacter deserti]
MAPTAVSGPERVRARDEVAALFERYRAEGDPYAQEQLVERFLPLARHLARKYISGNEREDVEQVAALGLLKAIDRFDPGRGLAFTSFAVPTILGEVKRYFRDLGWTVRVPRSVQELVPRVEKGTEELTAKLGRTPTADEVAERCGVSVEDVLEARGSASAHRADSLDRPVAEEGEASRGDLMGDVDPGFAHVEQAVDVRRMLASLPEREQKIVRLRFEGDLTQREIAEHVGLSQMHVSRLLRDALTLLAEQAPR